MNGRCSCEDTLWDVSCTSTMITPVLDFGDPDEDINYNIIHMLVTECFSVFSHGVLAS